MEQTILELKIRHIAKKYLSHNFYSYPSQKAQSHILRFDFIFHSSFQRKVELAFNSLSSPLKIIINNEFFYQDYPGWWKKKYSKKKYQKLKRKACTLFLEVFYEVSY